MKESSLYKIHQRLRQIPIIEDDITHVDLRRNDIRDINIPYNTNVVYLDLSDNKIKKIENISLPNLSLLDLSYNLIETIEQLPLNLQELYLIANDIKKIENLGLTKLIKLDLAVNEIETIENLEDCKKLEELYLGSNKIRNTGDLKHLTNLRILDLQNNLLEEFDCSLLPESLDTLLLSDNSKLMRINNLQSLPNLKLLTFERTSMKEVDLNGEVEVWK